MNLNTLFPNRSKIMRMSNFDLGSGLMIGGFATMAMVMYGILPSSIVVMGIVVSTVGFGAGTIIFGLDCISRQHPYLSRRI